MSPIFPIRFCCQCADVAVSWKIGKVEKEKALNPHKQEINKKMLCRKIYREIIITLTAQAHSEPSQTSKMEPFANITNYFYKKLHLRGGLYGGEFQPGSKFQLAKP